MPLAYAITSTLFFLVAFPFLLLWTKLRGGQRARFAWYPPGFPPPKQGPRVWLHAASSGDIASLSPVFHELRRRRPGLSIVVTSLTASGEALARARFQDADAVGFLPWDLPFVADRAVRALDPDVLVLEYTELWPALMHAAKRRGVKLAVTNGRLGERKIGRYRLLFALTGNLLQLVDRLLMREEAEKERALQLGAFADRVRVTGNTRFEAAQALPSGGGEELARALGLGASDRLLVAGATHEGEEAMLLEVFGRLRTAHPGLRMLLAPRYLERVPRVVSLARDAGFTVSVRSGPVVPGAPVMVLDTPDELGTAYGLAELAFVGGTFTDRGGQDLLEPAARGKAVLFGPRVENVHDSVQVLVGRGGVQVNDAAHLERVAGELLSQPRKLAELGALAQEVVSGIRGAAERDAEEILALLDERTGSQR